MASLGLGVRSRVAAVLLAGVCVVLAILGAAVEGLARASRGLSRWGSRVG